MGSISPEPPTPWIETPCLHSPALSAVAGCNIFLKLDNLQPAGSFKSRGVGNLMFRAVADASPDVEPHIHFFCASGGNAGLACATSALALGRPATIVVPLSTPAYMVARLRALDPATITIIQAGENWGAADAVLRNDHMAHHNPPQSAVYVSPFDHPHIWAGAATIVDECARQLGPTVPVDGYVCSVGGGGLMCGLLEGIETLRLKGSTAVAPEVRVLAVETEGAGSLYASVQAGELVTLPHISTVANSLGAPRVAEKAFEWMQKCGWGGAAAATAKGPRTVVTSMTVSDRDAVMGSVRFLDDARILVEYACGATLATVYNGDLRQYVGEGLTDEEWARRNVVVVVCGGSNVNLDGMNEYRKRFDV